MILQPQTVVKSDSEGDIHFQACERLAGWLRDASALSDRGIWSFHLGRDGIGQALTWRHNRPAPNYGVWREYPFPCPGGAVWDETERADGTTWQSPPTFKEYIAAIGHPPCYIADIALQHKGAIWCAVEVRHTNPTRNEKIESLIHDGGVPLVLEVDAKWVLMQAERPVSMLVERACR